jgi:hypothetical protein
LCYKGKTMNEIERRFRNRIVLLAGIGGAVLLVLALCLAKGVLQVSVFGIICLVWCGAMFAAFLGIILWYRKANAKFRKVQVSSGVDVVALDRDRAAKSVRSLKRGIVFMLLLLPYGLWQTRGVPWPPRAAGVAANLMITGTLAVYLARAKRKLKEQ